MSSIPVHFSIASDGIDEDIVIAVANAVLAGAVGVIPTDTVHGLVGLDTAENRARIDAMKVREAGKQYPVLVADITRLYSMRVICPPALSLIAEQFWPGALTMVLHYSEGGGTVGVRVPRHDFLLAVLERIDKPVIATSANASGIAPAVSLSRQFDDLDAPPDFIVDGVSGGGTASTVARLDGDTVVILREGPVSAAELQACITPRPAVPILSN